MHPNQILISSFLLFIIFGGFSDSYNTGINAINGIIDEVRISNIARSPEWISTSYANQNNPSTFLLIGEENQRRDKTVLYSLIQN